MDVPEQNWLLGDQVLVNLPDGQDVLCQVVLLDDGTVQIVPEHDAVIG